MAKCSKNLRAKRRRRIKAGNALLCKLALLVADRQHFFEQYVAAEVGWAEEREKRKKAESQLASLAAGVEMILKGRMLVKVLESSSPPWGGPGPTMVRVRYNHPDSALCMPSKPDPAEAFAAVADKIASRFAGDPAGLNTFVNRGFSEEFYREFLADVHGDVVMDSLRHLGDQLAVAIFAGVCVQSVKLASVLKGVNRG